METLKTLGTTIAILAGIVAAVYIGIVIAYIAIIAVVFLIVYYSVDAVRDTEEG